MNYRKCIAAISTIVWIFLFPQTGQGQKQNGTLVEIGDGDFELSLPITPWYSYNYSQTIYYQSEINQTDKLITNIFYHWNGDTPGVTCKDWKIYMGHTTKNQFVSGTDWIPYSQLEKVFDGEVDLPAAATWVNITLDEPFVYNNLDNLAIAVYEFSPGWMEDSFFYGTETSSLFRGLVYFDDDVNPDPDNPPYGVLEGGFANIRFQMIDLSTCPVPVDLYTSDINHNSASLGWTGNETFFDIELVQTGEEFTGLPVFSGTVNPFAVTGLEPATSYAFSVRADCGDGLYSTWSEPKTFSTTATEPGAPETRFLQNETISQGVTDCFDATQTITLAGDGTTFVVESQASITLVAGQNILMLPGTHIMEGAYLQASIAQGGPFCPEPEKHFVLFQEGSETIGSKNPLTDPFPRIALETAPSFRAHPNPTSGQLTLDLSGFDDIPLILVEIYGIRGEAILRKEFPASRRLFLNIDNQPPGIYMIRVIGEKSSCVERIIKISY